MGAAAAAARDRRCRAAAGEAAPERLKRAHGPALSRGAARVAGFYGPGDGYASGSPRPHHPHPTAGDTRHGGEPVPGRQAAPACRGLRPGPGRRAAHHRPGCGRRAHRRLTDGPDGDAARRFVRNAYRHGKAVAAYGAASALLTRLLPDGLRVSAPDGEVTADRGVVSAGSADSPFTEEFVKAVAAHRFPDRPPPPGLSGPTTTRARPPKGRPT
ncbi:hypothetical protein ACFWMQ_18210 [Streptomyces sp. NPDC058372]|uniref:hypothetical protein n=1 Tax=Streptomyces sp. NPDC058372 TaxID=3346464 RepID=UPI00366A05B6